MTLFVCRVKKPVWLKTWSFRAGHFFAMCRNQWGIPARLERCQGKASDSSLCVCRLCVFVLSLFEWTLCVCVCVCVVSVHVSSLWVFRICVCVLSLCVAPGLGGGGPTRGRLSVPVVPGGGGSPSYT